MTLIDRLEERYGMGAQVPANPEELRIAYTLESAQAIQKDIRGLLPEKKVPIGKHTPIKNHYAMLGYNQAISDMEEALRRYCG